MLNPYFNLNNNSAEQDLIDGLIQESIQIHGFNIIYAPFNLVAEDKLLGEDPMRAFTVSYEIEMYFNDVEGFLGDKNFISKLGWNIGKQAEFIVSDTRFKETTNMERPREGDLLYFPLTKDIFEIKFADHEDVFYQLGRIYVWKLSCEKYKFSHEELSTGNSEIDAIADEFANIDSVANDPTEDNTEINTKITDFLDTSQKSPFMG